VNTWAPGIKGKPKYQHASNGAILVKGSI
jgi:hypothetical protein